MKHIKQWHQNLESNVSWYRKWHEGEFHKIVHFGILIFSVLFTILLIVSSTNVKAIGTTYYVSSTGSDSNNGTSTSTPWQTLTKVNNTTFAAGDKILFKAGDTFTGTIIPTDSGTSTNPITYGMYGTGAKPVITGFASVSGWTEVNKAGVATPGTKIWQSNNEVTTLGTVNMILINGVNTAYGRTPNTGYWTIQSVILCGTAPRQYTCGITDAAHLNASTTDWNGANVVARTAAWHLDRDTVTSASGNTIRFNRMDYSAEAQQGYFLQNHFYALDLQNEWASVPGSKKVMIYSASAPTNVKVPTIEYGANLNGKNYITFDGLNFQGFNSHGVYVNGSNGITVQNSDFSLIADGGVYTYTETAGGEYLTVSNSTFNEINSGGVITRQSGYTTVQNSTFNKIGNLEGMAGGPSSGGDVNYTAVQVADHSKVLYNTIANVGYVGIRFNGPGVLVQGNYVDRTTYVKDDGGGIYTFPNEGDYDEPIIYTGANRRTVRDNIVLNSIGAPWGKKDLLGKSEGMCIYNDGTSSYTDYLNNTMAYCRWGYFSNGGKYNTISGNTIYMVPNAIYGHATGDIYGISQKDYKGETWTTLEGNNYTNNTVVMGATNAGLSCGYGNYALEVLNRGNALPDDWTASNNIYANPLDQTNPLITSEVGMSNCSTLAQWQNATGKDTGTTGSPIIVSSASSIKFEYATSSPKTLDLSAGYVDMKGVVQACSRTIPAYSSVILLKKPNTTCTGTSAPTVSLTNPLNTTPVTAVEGTQFQVSASTTGTGITSVAFYLDGTTTLLPGCTPNPDTTSSYGCIWNTTQVSDGTHTITAKVSTATTSSISSVVTVNVQNGGGDTTAPTFQPASSLTTPSANTSVPVGTTYTISATATDNVAMKHVEFYKDGVLINTDYTGPSSIFSYDWNTTGLTVGSTHSWTAKAYDTATPANVSTTTARVITIGAAPDTTPPTVTLTAPTGSYYRPGATITIKATATDNIGVSKVEFYVDDVLKCTDTTVSYTCSWKVPSSPIGSFSIKAIAYDAATNNTSSIIKKVKNTKLTVPTSSVNAGPDQTITLPTNSVTLNGSYTSGLSINNVSTWTKVSGSGTITDPSNVVTTITGLTAGTSVFKLSLNDGTTTVSDTVSIIVNPVPTASKFTFTDLRSNETSGITTVLVDVASTVGATITKVEFFVDGTTKIGEDLTWNTYSTTWDTTAFSNGNHSITARATDSLGNAETSSAVVVNVTN